MNRRAFLAKGAAAGMGLAAGGSFARAAFGATYPHKAGDRPYPSLPAGTESIPQIQHIVVLMMENHSFDNTLGALGRRGVDGLSFTAAGQAKNWNPGSDGQPVYASPAPSTCQAGYTISQSWDASHQCWDSGRNDGFARVCGDDAMYYYTDAEMPFYWALASVFPVCDRYFCSTMAQTYPNRRFLIAGSAFGQVDDPLPGPTDPNPRPWGFGTIFDMLNAYGITWKDYFADLPTAGLFPYVVENNPGNVVPVADFFTDCALGTLPSFSIVDPESFEGSEENPQDAQTGAYYAYQVIDAVMRSPAWPSTALVLTFDEHGGYYDHVPPVRLAPPDDIPPSASTTYGDTYTYSGFRVPTVVVSPWTKANYVSHTIYDHTSILRLVETKWNLPALSNRDANANAMLDCFDFRAPAFLTSPVLAAAPPPSGSAVCIAQDPTGQ
ncbi:MAG TPA: alkaline phosphatase family protein [Gaiellaceae bacterium]|nr:alkaline phosphatase family protein [Gaiellaceae bacterium]